MVSKHKLLTLDEFLALPEEKPYLELIDGEVAQKPVGKTEHAIAQINLGALLRAYARQAGGRAVTELGVKFPWTARPNFRVPDVSYFLPGNEPRRGEPYPDYPPDLAAEIRSEGQTVGEMRRRLEFLREQGTRWTLLVDPDNQNMEISDGSRTWLAASDDLVTLEGLLGFSFLAKEVFE